MNNDELMQLAEMFDTIVNSDNPAVQRSLQYTVVLARLAQEKQNMEGPFLKMFRTMADLREDMAILKRSVQILENNASSLFTSSNQANYGNDYVYRAQSMADLSINIPTFPTNTIKLSNLTISGVEGANSMELFGSGGAVGASGSDDIVWIDNASSKDTDGTTL